MADILFAGGGVSSIATLYQLVRHKLFDESINIYIVDKSSHIGRGKPYIYDDERLLMNIPTKHMTLGEGDDHFIDWLEKNGYESHEFMSREIFGHYLRSLLYDIERKYENVHIEIGLVNAIYQSSNGKFIATINDMRKEFDQIFLGIGQLEYQDPYHLKGMNGYIYDPYPVQEKLKYCEHDATLGIIGSGLSAIDCMRYLIYKKKVNHLYIFARSGYFPSVRGTYYKFEFKFFTLDEIHSKSKFGIISLKSLIELLKKEAKYQNVDLNLMNRRTGDAIKDITYDLEHMDEVGKLQHFLIELDHYMSHIFQMLTMQDKKLFMDKYHPYIDENHSPMPENVGRDIVEWLKTKQITVVEDLLHVEKSKCETHFNLSSENEQYQVDVLINATGPITNIEKSKQTLIEQLYNYHLITPYPLGGICIDENNQVISHQKGTIEGMYTLGALSFGKDYMSNFVTLLAINGQTIANHMIKKLKKAHF